MKNIEIKKDLKRLIAMGALSFVLVTTGCSNKENNAKPSNEVTTEIENNNEQEATDNTNEETFDNFASEREEIDSLIYTENFEKVDEVWGDYFIDAIDFIFYGKEYKDTKFADLNPEAQAKCIEEFINTKNKIESINPNWQEDIENIKGSAIEAYYNILEKIEQLIGTENYNNIGDLINSGKDGLKNIGNDIRDTVDHIYQEYKSNHKY